MWRSRLRLAFLCTLFALLVACGSSNNGNNAAGANNAAKPATNTGPASAGTAAPASGAAKATAAAQKPNRTQPTTDKLTIALSQLPDLIDPRLANPQAKVHLTLLFDNLVGMNSEGTDVSKDTGVASSWDSPDQQTWTFHLRPGYTFSNGQPLTSDDVVFSLQRVMDKAAKSPYAGYFQTSVDTITAPSTDTVVIKLKKPDFSLPYYLSPMQGTEGMIVPKAYLTSVGDTVFAQKPIGSGPYVLKSINPGISLTYQWRGQAHPVYGVPRYNTITIMSAPDQTGRTAMLQTGQADIVDLDLASVDPKSLGDQYNIVEKPAVNVIGVQIHTQWKDVPVHNEMIREALALAINADEINQTIYRGLGKLTGVAFVGSYGLGYQPMQPYGFDPNKAKQLLAQAGYDKTPIDLYAFDIAGVPGESQTAQAIAGYWKDVGVNVNLKQIDYNSFRPLWFDKSTNGATSVIGISNGLLALDTFNGQFTSKGAQSYVMDPALDQLIGQMQQTTGDLDKYKAMTPVVEKYIHDHYLSIPLLEVGSFYAANKKTVPAGWTLGKGKYDINTQNLISQ